MTEDKDPVLQSLSASKLRLVSILALLMIFAVIMVQIAVELPSDRMLAKAGLAVMGAVLVWQAVRVWTSSRHRIELTPSGLRWSKTGAYLAKIEEIKDVNTSIIAFRPATGFLVILHGTAPAATAPGLWWRVGNRLGIGGVTAKYEAKAMAEMLREMTRARMASDMGIE